MKSCIKEYNRFRYRASEKTGALLRAVILNLPDAWIGTLRVFAQATIDPDFFGVVDLKHYTTSFGSIKDVIKFPMERFMKKSRCEFLAKHLTFLALHVNGKPHAWTKKMPPLQAA